MIELLTNADFSKRSDASHSNCDPDEFCAPDCCYPNGQMPCDPYSLCHPDWW